MNLSNWSFVAAIFLLLQIQYNNCQCPEGLTGPQCETDIDECENDKEYSSYSNICGYEGTCINTQGGFYCDCPSGYRGVGCREDVNECSQIPGVCRQHEMCLNRIRGKGYTCTGPHGLTGQNCSLSAMTGVPGLVVSGGRYRGGVNTVLMVDPDGGLCTADGVMPNLPENAGHWQHSVVATEDGGLISCGGSNTGVDDHITSTCFMWRKDDGWKKAEFRLPLKMGGHQIVDMGSRIIALSGWGIGGRISFIFSREKEEISCPGWKMLGALEYRNGGHCSVVVNDTMLIVTGQSLTIIDLQNENSDQDFDDLVQRIEMIPRWSHGCALYGSQLVVAGGRKQSSNIHCNYNCDRGFVATSQVYNLDTGEWTDLNDMPTVIGQTQLKTVPDNSGRMVAVSEEGYVDILDMVTMRWTSAGRILAPDNGFRMNWLLV